MDHRLHRRLFLQELAAGATSLPSFGGLFQSFPTKVPGVPISALMPKCASILDQLASVRSRPIVGLLVK